MTTTRNPLEIETQTLDAYIRGMSILNDLSIAQSEIPPRRFKGGELDEIVKVKFNAIYNAEARGALPVVMERDHLNRRLGYTLEEVVKLQEYYDTSMRRKDGEPCVVLSFTNFKGGCWKTTTSLNFASYFANKGLRVLLIDLDPQSSLTESFGLIPGIDIDAVDTLLPFIMGGDEDHPEMSFKDDDVGRIIRKTHVPTLDLIPCTKDMEDVIPWLVLASHLASIKNNDEGEHEQRMLTTRVKKLVSHMADDYDIVIIDGTPSLNLLNENIIVAADEIIVPVPTEFIDFASTLKFSYKFNEKIGELADWLGSEDAELFIPGISYLPTRYSRNANQTVAADQVLECIHHTWGEQVFANKITKHDSIISNLGMLRRSVFDVNLGKISTSKAEIQISRTARINAIKNFSETFDEIFDRCVRPYWPSLDRLDTHLFKMAERD